MRTFPITLLAFLFLSPLFSQNKGDDTLSQLSDKAEGFVFTNKDSAYYYFDRAITLSKKQDRKDITLSLYDYLVYTTTYYFDWSEYSKQLKLFETEVSNASSSMSDLEYYQNSVILFYGNYYFDLKQYGKAKLYFEKIFKQLSSIPEDDLSDDQISAFLSSLDFLGLINKNKGQYERAKIFFEKQIRLCQKREQKNVEIATFKVKSMMVLADLLIKQEQYEKAQNILEDCVVYYETKATAGGRNSLIVSYLNLSELYLKKGNHNRALLVLDKIKNLTGIKFPFQKRADLNRSEIFIEKKQFSKSKVLLDQILKTTIAIHQKDRHKDIADIYLKLGDLARSQKNVPIALDHYQNALIAASNGFKSKKWDENPTPTDVFSKIQLLTILRKKIEAINAITEREQAQKKLQANDKTAQTIIATLDAIRPEFESKIDKQFLLAQTYPTFHEMIDAAYKAYKSTKEQKYLENAFLYMEKSKGILLLESVKNAEANAFGAIPNATLEKELHYRAYITNIEKKQATSQKASSAILDDSLFNIKNKYHEFLKGLKEKFPAYYHLKYDTKTINIGELQSYLSTNESVISFHQTENTLYVILVDKSQTHFLKLPFSTKTRENIKAFYKLLSKPTSANEHEIPLIGNRLYAELVAPWIDKTKTGQITIIADGLLHYIPFGTLTDGAGPNKYLLHKVDIAYAGSATILCSSKSKRYEVKKGLLAIAPTFAPNTGFNQLPFAQKEVKSITESFAGKTVLGNEASLTNFLNIKDDFSIFHFATHAIVDDNAPDFSYLAFSTGQKAENRLYIKDLYNIRLDAIMVTLSACETGVGKLLKGEGMLSLARGFQYAGVNSLTTSLWKNDDQATSELMGYYYEHLSNGHSKSKALQKAKLEYLESTEEEELKHPYYWAGFVVLGNNSPISEKPTSPWIYFGIGLIGVGILGFGYKKVKAHQVAS